MHIYVNKYTEAHTIIDLSAILLHIWKWQLTWLLLYLHRHRHINNTYYRHIHSIYKCICIAFYKWCSYFLSRTPFQILTSPEKAIDLLIPCSYLQKTFKHLQYLSSRPRALTTHMLFLYLLQICFLLGQWGRRKELLKTSPQKPQEETSYTMWGQAEGTGGPHPSKDHTKLPALLLFGQKYDAIGLKIFFPLT